MMGSTDTINIHANFCFDEITGWPPIKIIAPIHAHNPIIPAAINKKITKSDTPAPEAIYST
jgi:hypothetical protein